MNYVIYSGCPNLGYCIK